MSKLMHVGTRGTQYRAGRPNEAPDPSLQTYRTAPQGGTTPWRRQRRRTFGAPPSGRPPTQSASGGQLHQHSIRSAPSLPLARGVKRKPTARFRAPAAEGEGREGGRLRPSAPSSLKARGAKRKSNAARPHPRRRSRGARRRKTNATPL